MKSPSIAAADDAAAEDLAGSKVIDRRRALGAVLGGGALLVAAGVPSRVGARPLALDAPDRRPMLRIGLVSDVHSADKDTAGSRFYRDSLAKIAAAIAHFKRVGVDFVVELGDLVDRAKDVETEIGYLTTIERVFSSCGSDRHYVLGNHCVDTLTKAEFLANCGLRKTARDAFYSFDRGALHCVVLDSCFRADGVAYGRKNFEWTDADIPGSQHEWLRRDLASTTLPTVVFVHHRLDVDDKYAVKSAAAVRAILEASGKVLAVFQGHNHVNDHRTIGDVSYVTLTAMIEGALARRHNAYAVLECFEDGSLRLEGFGAQKGWGRIGAG